MDLSFRAISRDDFPIISAWLAAPHVARWWQEDPSAAAVEARYGPSVDGTDLTEVFIVVADGEELGMIQRYRIDDNPSWIESLRPTGAPLDGAGIDYLIGDPERIGKGLGTAVIRAFVAATWERYPEVPALVVDVDPANPRSWRALEKVGFVRVWEGDLEAEDPTDAGLAYVYVLERPTESPTQVR